MESEQHSGVSHVNGPSSINGDDTTSIPGEILKNLQNVSYFYRQDVVRRKTNSGIGIVTEVAGDLDSDGSMTDDEGSVEDVDDEEDEDAGSNKDDDTEKNSNVGQADAADDNDNNNPKRGPLAADQIRVLWMDGPETTESTNDVEVIDRGFLHGDYVAAASDPTGQIGITVDVDITVDLLGHDGLILKDRSCRDLRRIRDFTVGDHVVLGPWLGRIEDVSDNVTVQLDDGSVCRVTKADPMHLKPVGKSVVDEGHFQYYPGQRVRASSSSVFKNSRWLSGMWKANRLEGTVTNVTAGSVFVNWIASAGYGPDSATTPDEEQTPKNLKLLTCFAHTNWQLGDWCMLLSSQDSSGGPLNKGTLKLDSNDSVQDEQESTETGGDSDVEEESAGHTKVTRNSSEVSMGKDAEDSSALGYKEAVHETWQLHCNKIRKMVVRKGKKSRKKIENFEQALSIINTHTKVDVVWQDGSIKRGLETTSLIPVDSPGDHEFVAEQYVVEKAADSDDADETRRVGVIKSVNAKDKTACVRWLKPVARAEDPQEFDKGEMVSVYELEGHPDYDYCYGDIVVRLSPISFSEKMVSFVHYAESPKVNSLDDIENGRARNTENVFDMSAEFSELSWVGNITGLKDGDIEVTWADGIISTVGPQAVYVVDRDDDESIAVGSDASDDGASWETVEEDMDNAEEHEADDADDINSKVESNYIGAENSGISGALSIPLAAIGFVAKLASGLFSRGRKGSDEEDLHSDNSTLDIDPDIESNSQKPNDTESEISNPITTYKGEEHDIAESSDLLEVAETLCNLKLSQSDAPMREEFISTFKGFDIVRDPADHYFLGTPGQNNAARKWLKKVQQDWDILQNNLPEGIYVRVYEDRMDLLRAVISGAYGTPYQDGLFFFDFLLPPEYPDVPPSAYYHSGGWRINPNLYEEGKVCLSLLNTWTGRGNEVWDPSTSSILQVLVSLQGLVLNSRPYFNEAGYDKQVGTAEGEKNSLSYNENTFLLNCKTMMYLMRKPPKDFEGLVTEHFRKQGYCILKACDAYMKGHLIGSLTKDASISDGNTNSNSVGFKLMLGKVVPKLFAALKNIGADCQEFKHLNQIPL